MKSEFLLLAHVYDKQPIGSWFASEKLDGQRCVWDSGLTRGLDCRDVPYANTTKDARYIIPPKATGLWSRYGKPIQAPDWFLDLLPEVLLDGELYLGPGQFQETSSIVRQLHPDDRWQNIKLKVFDSPPPRIFFGSRDLKGKFEKKILYKGQQPKIQHPHLAFKDVYKWMSTTLTGNQAYDIHNQHELPFYNKDAIMDVGALLEKVVAAGGEGLVLRDPRSMWVTQRSHSLLKLKPWNDAEAVVVGYVWGRETDLGSKLLGLMGALVVRWNGITFELSGFTDAERVLSLHGGTSSEAKNAANAFGASAPGLPVDSSFASPQFPIGSTVTFRYRELTDRGCPKEARYWRMPNE